MEPLDLRLAPPRPGRAPLDGLIFMPRTVDKLRAQAPNGHLGPYKLAGLSEVMCTMIGVSVEQLRTVVLSAPNEAAVATCLRANADVESYEKWNGWISEHSVPDEDLPKFKLQYPVMNANPELRIALDILAADDAACFPSTPPAPPAAIEPVSSR